MQDRRFPVTAALLALTGISCTELQLRKYHDQAFLDQYHYALGEQYVELDGVRICYQEYGSGDPVLIIPGLGTSIDFWQLNIPALAEHHRVLALDIPGWGKSDKPDASYELQWICLKILAFMDARSVSHATLIGGSMGGHLALMLALDFPERVDKLVLMGSVGDWRPPGPLIDAGLRTLWNEMMVGGFFRYHWVHIFPKLFKHSRPMVQTLFRYQMAIRADSRLWEPESRACTRAIRSIMLNSCRHRLGEVVQPVLLIWGESDMIHRPENGRDFRRLLPWSHFVVVPDAAHEAMADQPEVFNRTVLSFLDGGLDAVQDSYPVHLEHVRK